MSDNLKQIKMEFVKEYKKKYGLKEGTNHLPFARNSIVIDKAAYDLIKLLQQLIAGEELELSNFQKSVLMFKSQEEYDRITSELKKLGVEYEDITATDSLKQKPTADDELDPDDANEVSPLKPFTGDPLERFLG